jgi:hypothetical protein
VIGWLLVAPLSLCAAARAARLEESSSLLLPATGLTPLLRHRHAFDLSQWHTVRFERRNHVVKAYIDDLRTPVWTYRGSSRTLPDTKKQVVLQQECRPSGCPAGTTGTEDIQIDWITLTTRPEHWGGRNV